MDQLLDKLSDPVWIQAIASLITALGVCFVWMQVRLTKQQAQITFEDSLDREYRKLIAKLPIDALLGKDFNESQLNSSLGCFYRYFDLSNEQVLLHGNKRRIRKATWEEWGEGIVVNLGLPAFRKAWDRIQNECKEPVFKHPIFKELREFAKLPDTRVKSETTGRTAL